MSNKLKYIESSHGPPVLEIYFENSVYNNDEITSVRSNPEGKYAA